MKKIAGFTLTEMVVALAIVGLLVVTARPFYKIYQVKTNRSTTQAELTRIAQVLHSHKVQNGDFSGAKPFVDGISSISFPALKPTYTIGLQLTNNNSTGVKAQGFVLTATPVVRSVQALDGVICINNYGNHYWVLGSKSCALTEKTTWYGE